MELSRAHIFISAAVILDDRGRFLVVRKRNTTLFMQAGGKIETGEESSLTVRRELREELGISVDEIYWLGNLDAPAAHEPRTDIHAHMYRAYTSDIPSPLAEIAEIAWLDLAVPTHLPLAPLTRMILEIPHFTAPPPNS